MTNRLTEQQRDQARAYFSDIMRRRKQAFAEDDKGYRDWCDGRMDGIIGLLVFWNPKLDPELGAELQRLKTNDYLASEGYPPIPEVPTRADWHSP